MIHRLHILCRQPLMLEHCSTAVAFCQGLICRPVHTYSDTVYSASSQIIADGYVGSHTYRLSKAYHWKTVITISRKMPVFGRVRHTSAHTTMQYLNSYPLYNKLQDRVILRAVSQMHRQSIISPIVLLCVIPIAQFLQLAQK